MPLFLVIVLGSRTKSDVFEVVCGHSWSKTCIAPGPLPSGSLAMVRTLPPSGTSASQTSPAMSQAQNLMPDLSYSSSTPSLTSKMQENGFWNWRTYCKWQTLVGS